ncbi:hypothetical protein BMI90_18250 [Thioclava sp. L04-15]|nr:hypothetical protein BMI90_18250 [Thioclava sp. L04-15]
MLILRQGGHDEQRPTFSDDFKRDAVAQITERGFPVREVAERLGVSQYSLYSWKKKFAKASSGDAEKDAEIRRLKRELLRVTEERDILKKRRPRISPGMPSEIRVRGRASRAVLYSGDVSLLTYSAEWLLRVAEGPTEQASSRRRAADCSAEGGMGGKWQGLRSPQTA